MTTINRDEVDGYIQQSHAFLAKSRQYVADNDLHQASEKAWGAAAHMAKAVAVANGWRYESHADFSRVMNNARNATGDDQLWTFRAVANDMHGSYYQRAHHLDAEAITAGIDQIEDLLDRLTPLTA